MSECRLVAVETEPFEQAVDADLEGRNNRDEDDQRRDDSERDAHTEVADHRQRIRQIRQETDRGGNRHENQCRSNESDAAIHRRADAVVRAALFPIAVEDVESEVDTQSRDQHHRNDADGASLHAEPAECSERPQHRQHDAGHADDDIHEVTVREHENAQND